MKTTKKSAPKSRFEVPAPVQKALRSAGTELDRLGVRAKSAAQKAEKSVRAAARDLAKTGETFRKDPRAFVEDVVESGKGFGADVRVRVQKAGKEAAKRAEGVTKMVGDTVGTAVEKGLHRLNVPTRNELRTLAAKVDTLGRKIDTLKARRQTSRAR